MAYFHEENEDWKRLTIGELLDALTKAKDISPYGKDTPVILCESEREYTHFADAGLEYDPKNPDDGALFLISLHPMSEKTSQIKG